MQSEKIEINSLSEMQNFARSLVSKFGKRQLILLKGEMGAGKTHLIKFVAEAVGAKEVASPTFAIHNSYETDSVWIDHVDLYRIETQRDLETTAFWELFDAEEGWIFVEWADRIERNRYPEAWPVMEIEISKGEGEKQRQIHLLN